MIIKINKIFKDRGYKKEKVKQHESSDYLEFFFFYDEGEFIEILKRDSYYSLFFHSNKTLREKSYLGVSFDVIDDNDLKKLDEYLQVRLTNYNASIH